MLAPIQLPRHQSAHELFQRRRRSFFMLTRRRGGEHDGWKRLAEFEREWRPHQMGASVPKGVVADCATRLARKHAKSWRARWPDGGKSRRV